MLRRAAVLKRICDRRRAQNAFTTIGRENTYSQKKMLGDSVRTGSFFLTKLHKSNSRGLAQ